MDYYDSWDEEKEFALHDLLAAGKANFMLSTWHHNDYRENVYIGRVWNECHVVTRNHFYHVGAKEQNRNPMVEALLTNYPIVGSKNELLLNNRQLGIADFFTTAPVI